MVAYCIVDGRNRQNMLSNPCSAQLSSADVEWRSRVPHVQLCAVPDASSTNQQGRNRVFLCVVILQTNLTDVRILWETRKVCRAKGPFPLATVSAMAFTLWTKSYRGNYFKYVQLFAEQSFKLWVLFSAFFWSRTDNCHFWHAYPSLLFFRVSASAGCLARRPTPAIKHYTRLPVIPAQSSFSFWL